MSNFLKGQRPNLDVRSLYIDKKKPHRWIVLKEIHVILSNGDSITIPRGYVTDFASVPRGLRGIIPTIGNHKLAVIIHDWLYDNRLYSREFADREMALWLKETGSSAIKVISMYYPVRLRGQGWWDRDTMEIREVED